MLKLKELRLSRNLTQTQLSEMLNITTRTYQYIEHGEQKPSYRVIVKLQKIFNTDIETLLTETGAGGKIWC